MITINCFNPKCPRTKFEWNEKSVGGIGRGNECDENTHQFPAVCPYCHTENYVWVKIGKGECEKQKAKPTTIFREK